LSAYSAFRAPNSALLFDAVGTLIYADPSPAAVYAEVGRRHGVTLDEREIARRFRAAFAAEETADRCDPLGCTDEARELRRWRTIVAATFVECADAEPLLRELWDHFAQPSAWRAYDDALDVVRQLAARNVVMGVASNFDARLHAIIAAHFPALPAAQVFASSELGYRKPAVDFFRSCERHLPACHSFTLVGDDWENDVVGAQRAGWSAVYLDRAQKSARMHESISKLHDLI
jgi:putative hydrolase of the HAD superfamily